MIRILKSFAAKTLAAGIALVVISGVLVAAMHLLLPWVSAYRDQLSGELSDRVGAPVRIERLGARLAGLSPELSLSGVEILDPRSGQVRLRFDRVLLRVGLLASVRGGQTQVELTTIVGARLYIQRDEDGRLRLVGLAGEPRGDAALSVARFLGDGRLRLRDGAITWDDRYAGMPPVHFRDVDAQLVNAGARHQLSVTARLPGAAAEPGRLEIRADLFGGPKHPGQWRGQVYAQTRNAALAPLLGALRDSRTGLSGRMDAQVWGQLAAGRLTALDGHVHLQALGLTSDNAPQQLLDSLSADLRARAVADTWTLSLQSLVVQRDGRRRAPTEAALRVRRDAGQTQLAGRLGRVWLEDLDELVMALPLESTWRELLAGLAPRGLLSDLRFRLRSHAAEASAWQLAGRLEGLALRPHGALPGVSGLGMQFRADQDHGIARLASDDLRVTFRELFRWPLEISRLGGALAWRRNADGAFELTSDEMTLHTADIETRSRLSLRLPGDAGPPFLDMQTDFANADGSATSKYIPVSVLSDPLVSWLDRAIVSGRVPSGAFLFRGPVDAFPFYRQEGRFQVLFGVQDTIVDFQHSWPRLEEMVAEVQFLNQRLDIELHEASLLESRVRQAHLWLPDLDNARKVYIDGQVRGPFADGLRILRETPLADNQGRYVRGMRAEGQSDIGLSLEIPVKKGELYRIDGHVDWQRAALHLDDWKLKLQDLTGRLRFTNDGVFAAGLRARLWDDPVRIDLDTSNAASGASSSRLEVALNLNPEHLAKAYAHPLWRELRGAAPATLELDIEHAPSADGQLPMRYRFHSKLRGLAVDLPAPLGKRYSEARRLEVRGRLPLAAQSLVEAEYGDIAGVFRLAAGEDGALRLEAGNVQCGEGRPDSVQGNGISVSGRLPVVDVEGWMDWLGERELSWGASDNGPAQPEQRIDLAIDELRLPIGTMRDLNLVMQRTPNAWEASLQSAMLSGDIRFPDDPRALPISARLRRLSLNSEALEAEQSSGQDAPAADPRRAPGLFLSVDQLLLDERPLGRLSLKAVPSEQGLDIPQLSIDGPNLKLQASGTWHGSPRRQLSSFSIEASSPDLGAALRELRIDSAIAEASASVRAELQWPSAPSAPSLANLAGTLEIHIGEGRVLDVDPGVGRFLGLMNLGALKRRLSLDFTDLFSKGYAFDRIDGSFTLIDGDALADKVSIIGPSADLEVSGRTGLTNRDYDQVVTVTPEISTTLPVAGMLAGGPAVGAALLVAQRVMGNEVNKLIRFQYKVEGPWEDPSIQRLQRQDSRVTRDLPGADATALPPDQSGAADGGLFVH